MRGFCRGSALQLGRVSVWAPFRERRKYVPVGSLSNVLFSRVPEGRRALSRSAVSFREMGSTEPPPPPTLVHRCWYPERFGYLEAELCGGLPGPCQTGRLTGSLQGRTCGVPGRPPHRSASRIEISRIDFPPKRDEPKKRPPGGRWPWGVPSLPEGRGITPLDALGEALTFRGRRRGFTVSRFPAAVCKTALNVPGPPVVPRSPAFPATGFTIHSSVHRQTCTTSNICTGCVTDDRVLPNAP